MSMTTPTSNLISSVSELKAFISSIPPSSTLYVDLEGNNLSRHGSISLITVLVHPSRKTGLIDVLVLGSSAFTAAADNGKSLKVIFEDPRVPKCFWDVRNDADALWALYKVGLAGVTDIQLLENASRTGDKTYVRGLDKCVQYDLKLGFMELNRWIRTKKDIQNLFSTNIFATRPLDPKTVQYCLNDVSHLPDLHSLYFKRAEASWRVKAMDESSRRVLEAHSSTYEPQSSTKRLGPWGAGTDPSASTLDEFLEKLEEKRMDDLEREMLGEVGYYEDDYEYYSEGGKNAADAALFSEYWDSCWERNS